MNKRKSLFILAVASLFIILLTGCSEFNGLRKPIYDGEAVIPDEDAIEIYRISGEIIGEDKENYLRYPFSEDIHLDSLPYKEYEPELITDGKYVIGEDVPAGRVSLLGNESSFSQESYDVQVGNLVIYDEAGDVYFENLFHPLYGQLVAQVDFIAGHTIEIIGQDAEITAFYTEEFPEDPYVLMDPPQILENLDQLRVSNPTVKDETNQSVQLTAGIYEVGVHLEPGTYAYTLMQAPHNTELFLFREGEEVRVFELLLLPQLLYTDGEELPENRQSSSQQIELQAGDKIYPNLVRLLEIQKMK